MNGIMIHCGAKVVEESFLKQIPTPQPEGKHYPISHDYIWQQSKLALGKQAEVVDQRIGVTPDGQRMFGLMELDVKGPDRDHSLMVGIRNSHDKTFAAGMVVGSRVFVCDNLSFSGEQKFARKHTTNIMKDIVGRIAQATEKIRAFAMNQQEQFHTYKNTELKDLRDVDHVLMQMYRFGVIPASAIQKVLREWESPRHEEFADRNVWSMFNAATEVLKGSNINTLPNRTRQLHNVCDMYTLDRIEEPEFVGVSGLPQRELADTITRGGSN